MKLKFHKFCLLAFFLVSDFVAFAQEVEREILGGNPGEGVGGGGGGLGTDDPVAPINGELIYLAIIGLAFAFYAYRRTKRTA
jgi:hypothetical protein